MIPHQVNNVISSYRTREFIAVFTKPFICLRPQPHETSPHPVPLRAFYSIYIISITFISIQRIRELWQLCLPVSFLFCCTYLLSLKYLHLCMPFILIPYFNCFVILEIIIARVRCATVCEANNQSKMWSEISSNSHPFSFPHLRNFSNHLHISFLIYTTNIALRSISSIY
jgi:hypothetical protein